MKKDKSVKKSEMKAEFVKRLKSLIGPLIILAVIGIGVLVISFWEEEEMPEEIIRVNSYEGEAEQLTLENDSLKLVMDTATTQFSIEDKGSGKIWYSNPHGVNEDQLALETEKDKLNSTLLLTYSTINGVDTLYNNYRYSIANGIYDIEQGEDYLKVCYSLGDMDKEYIIPPVIKAERMEELLSTMSKSDANRVKDYYKKYDINNLGKKDNKEELLVSYPILETDVIYVIRSTTKDNIKSKLEEYFLDAGYTLEEYQKDKELDNTSEASEKPVFNINVIYRLDGDNMVVEVPLEEIEYKEDYPVYNLTVLPYFGAGGVKDEGYMLVPEGGGALIDFNNGKTSQNSYVANVYGWDKAQDRDAIVHETRAYFNAFGTAKDDASFLCIMEEGAPYASVQADISGKNHSYNFVNATYSLLHREQYDVSDRITAVMYVYEDQLPVENLVQRYYFVDSNDYSDMAECYRNYMTEKYDGYLSMKDDVVAPVSVEVLCAVDKVKQVMGVPVSKPLELTTYKEAQEIIEELSADGFQNMSVKLTGWMNGGVNQKILKDIELISDLGSKKDLNNMIASAKQSGVDVYLDGITNYAYDSGLKQGFFSYTDAARFVSKEKAELYEYSTVDYGKRETHDTHYLLRGKLIAEMAQNLVDCAKDYNASISFGDYGYELSSDFYRKDLVSRQAAMINQAAQLKEIKDNGMKLMVNMGNDYAAPYSDRIVNMDLNGTEYTIIDKTVPFYQMALHGYVDYMGESLNNTTNSEDELLKSAEYGAGLSFTMMKETAFALQNTLYTQYFGADFDAWREQATDIYNRYNEQLGHIFNQKMVDHEFITDRLTCTTYEDGTKVYVNYSYIDAKLPSGAAIPPRDYVVER
ncbi:MAG: hypothetical protein E7231_08660 [Cellulosilyticum sp.]|nr:hypothetical protein [Cellulosilyticum sp.]